MGFKPKCNINLDPCISDYFVYVQKELVFDHNPACYQRCGLIFFVFVNLCYFQPPSEPAPAAAPAAPAAAASEPADADALPKYKRDLAAKARVLRAELQALQPQTGHCRIEVGFFFNLLQKRKT